MMIDERTLCPKCGQRALPPFSGCEIAVACQNPECGHIEKPQPEKGGAPAGPASPIA